MKRAIGRACGLLGGALALAVGILGLVPIWPNWLWISLGIAGLLFILGQFLWERRDEPVASIRQRQQSGKKSTNNQAGRDVIVNPPPSEKKK